MQGQVPPPTGRRSWFRSASTLTNSPALAPPSQASQAISNEGSASIGKSSPPTSPKLMIEPATLATTQVAPIDPDQAEFKSMLARSIPQPDDQTILSTEQQQQQHNSSNNNSEPYDNDIKSNKKDEEPYINNIETKLMKYSKKESDTIKWGTITIRGENMGAYMELANQNKKQSNNISKNNNMSKKEASYDKQMAALVNSNVQAINNSIVLNNAFAHRSPGVHLSLSTRSNN